MQDKALYFNNLILSQEVYYYNYGLRIFSLAFENIALISMNLKINDASEDAYWIEIG